MQVKPCACRGPFFFFAIESLLEAVLYQTEPREGIGPSTSILPRWRSATELPGLLIFLEPRVGFACPAVYCCGEPTIPQLLSQGWDSNPRPPVYKTGALTTELPWHTEWLFYQITLRYSMLFCHPSDVLRKDPGYIDNRFLPSQE